MKKLQEIVIGTFFLIVLVIAGIHSLFETIFGDPEEVIQKPQKQIEAVKEKKPPQKAVTPPKKEVAQKKIPVKTTSSIPKTPPPTNPNQTRVLKVVDGDTIEIMWNNKREKVRIKGLDTPEVKDPRYPVQCYGEKASQKAKDLLSGKIITVETDNSRGKYGRLLAYIRLKSGEDFGEKMIREGYAWHYRTFPHERMSVYDKAEIEARDNNRGLWAPDTCAGKKTAKATSSPPKTSKPVSTASSKTTKPLSKTVSPPAKKITKTPPPAPPKPEPEFPLVAPSAGCICTHNKYNCSDFETHTEAQAIFECCQKQGKGDIHKLDRDKNGIACEGLKK